jgi:hypothetical protein
MNGHDLATTKYRIGDLLALETSFFVRVPKEPPVAQRAGLIHGAVACATTGPAVDWILQQARNRGKPDANPPMSFKHYCSRLELPGAMDRTKATEEP